MSTAKRTTQRHSSSFCGSQKTCTSPSGTLTFVKIKCVSLHRSSFGNLPLRTNTEADKWTCWNHTELNQSTLSKAALATRDVLHKLNTEKGETSLLKRWRSCHWWWITDYFTKKGDFFLAISINTKHNWHPSFNTLQKNPKKPKTMFTPAAKPFNPVWSYRLKLQILAVVIEKIHDYYKVIQ